jgi:hypothetical protein
MNFNYFKTIMDVTWEIYQFCKSNKHWHIHTKMSISLILNDITLLTTKKQCIADKMLSDFMIHGIIIGNLYVIKSIVSKNLRENLLLCLHDILSVADIGDLIKLLSSHYKFY